ncbi:hypothetical protein [Aureimonas psammosilenae]|uniref:hypothetical protein n=1 Tax=Aureimonas psammosilenae TaxID=2495496 RepID=UPI00126047F9|nr:hypothetical protein [Aureimonas psammosilenae]
MFRLRPLALAIAALLPLSSGCVWASGTVETFEWRAEPVSTAPAEPALSPTEIRYARDTAVSVFRRRGAERTVGFVRSDAEGHALCLRSGKDYALLVFARRVFEEAISQAADDNTILRSATATAVCRERGRRWVAT